MSHFTTPPTLYEIADRLSVLHRWNGYTTLPWSVLQHSLLVNLLLPDKVEPSVRLHALLHDSAEAYIGDISRPRKTEEQAEYEDNMLREIYEVLGVECPILRASWLTYDLVRKADDLAALAEAEVLVHPSKRREVWTNTGYLTPDEEDKVFAGEAYVWQYRDDVRGEALDVWYSSVSTLISGVNDATD